MLCPFEGCHSRASALAATLVLRKCHDGCLKQKEERLKRVLLFFCMIVGSGRQYGHHIRASWKPPLC